MELIVLYGSQTGTAEDIAEYIWRKSKRFSFCGPVMPLDNFSLSKLINTGLAVFVVSTTGQGEEPDNMKNFWKGLLRKSLPANSLKHLKFACLGLGDSSYARYNFVAKRLYKRLTQLSASPVIPIGLCDDQHDLGICAVLLPWIKNLWCTLQLSHQKIENGLLENTCFKWYVQPCINSETNTSENKLLHLEKNTYVLQLKANIRTTAEHHFQDVRLLQFLFPKTCVWNPGDLLSLYPCNSDRNVEEFFEMISKAHCNRNMTVSISNMEEDNFIPIVYQKSISLYEAAKYVWDLTARPRQRAFELLAFNCKDEKEKLKLIELSTFEGLNDYMMYIHKPRRTILELLHDFPNATVALTPQIMFELFPIIKARLYSIASVPETESLDILVAVVDYKTTLSSPRLGLSSNWLKNLRVEQKILGTLKPSKMKIPSDIHIPLIMVSTGTGLAPFRSIILRREALLKKNICGADLIIFLGFRNKQNDFHCQTDFIRFERGKLIKYFPAFSRDCDIKIYVQNVITKNAALIENMLLKRNCNIFVVGSSKNMPKAVKEAFIEVIEGKDDVIDDMIKNGRYQEETWN